MVNINLILDGLKVVKSSKFESIQRAKGKYEYPETFRDLIRLIKLRYFG